MNASRVVAGLDAQGDVRLELALEPLLQVPRGEVLPLAGQRRVVDGEEHAQSVGSSTSIRGKATGLLGVGDRVADVDGAQPDDGDDVAGLGRLRPRCGPACRRPSRCRSSPATVTSPALIRTAFCPRLTRPATIRPIAIRPTYSEKSSVVQSIRNGLSGSTTGPGTLLDDHVEERLDVSRRGVGIVRGEAGLARGEDVGKIELIFAGPLLDERVEDLVRALRSGRASGRSILLITTIGRMWQANALRSTNLVCGIGPSKASTRTRAPSAICSVRSTSPPKSAWPGVSMMLILIVAVVDGDVLGQDRDAALALQIVGVEDPLALELRGPELPRLAEHRVDQRRLAVVNVGDDGHVSDVVASLHGFCVRRHRGGPVSGSRPRDVQRWSASIPIRQGAMISYPHAHHYGQVRLPWRMHDGTFEHHAVPGNAGRHAGGGQGRRLPGAAARSAGGAGRTDRRRLVGRSVLGLVNPEYETIHSSRSWGW